MYYLVCLIKIYKLTKLLLNKFISFFYKIILTSAFRALINEATKKVSQLDRFYKIFVSFLFK